MTTELKMQEKTESGTFQKTMLTFAEGAAYLGVSKGYLYRLTGSKIIPHYKPNGKKVYFKISELEAYMQRNRIATDEETSAEADNIIRKKGGVL